MKSSSGLAWRAESSHDGGAGFFRSGKHWAKRVAHAKHAPRGVRLSLPTTIVAAAIISALALICGPGWLVGPAGLSAAGDIVAADGSPFLDLLQGSLLHGGSDAARSTPGTSPAGDPAGTALSSAVPTNAPMPGEAAPSIVGAVSPNGPAGETGNLGIPLLVLQAYHRAADHLKITQPSCHLPWWLLAGIGHTESGHAESGRLYADGTTRGAILGPRLNGGIAGDAVITDTDGGRLDGDPVYDRAVGPMQFIPSTWANWASDGNGDGKKDPNNIFDATLAAGRYLCAGGRDLSTRAGMTSAVLSYNDSQPYLATVLSWGTAYRDGVTPLPVVTTPVVSEVINVRPPLNSRPVKSKARSKVQPRSGVRTSTPRSSASPSVSATVSTSPTASSSPTVAPAGSSSVAPTCTPAPSASSTEPSVSPSASASPSSTDPSPSASATESPTISSSPSVSASSTDSPSPSSTDSPTASSTASPGATDSSSTPTPSASLTRCAR